MKKLFYFLSFALVVSVYPQDFQVSNSGIYSVDIPHLAISGTTAHLIHGTNFNYYRFDANGPSAPIDTPMVPADNYGPATADIAVDDTNPNHIAIAYNDYHYDYSSGASFYGCYLTESSDGGQNWDAPTLLDTIQLGNSLDNMLFYLPQVEIVDGSLYVLGKVHSNSSVKNAVYIWYDYGVPVRIDDPANDDLEQAIGFTIEYHPSSGNWIAVSYGKMEDGHVKFYLKFAQGGDGLNFSDPVLVKDDGQTFLNTDNNTKAFLNPGGTLQYVYSSFSHGPKLAVSSDWGVSWQDAGIADSHQYTYAAFNRIVPEYNYDHPYYVKLLLDDNNDLVYFVSADLLNWQDGGRLNSENASIQMAGLFVDMFLEADAKKISSAWIDNRTGNEEIFYSRADLPVLVGVKSESTCPENYKLSQNYPNPFNPSTVIKYAIPEAGFVSLTIYNSLGELVETLVNQEQSPGEYSVEFNANNLSSGIYYYHITADKFSSTKKMMLLK